MSALPAIVSVLLAIVLGFATLIVWIVMVIVGGAFLSERWHAKGWRTPEDFLIALEKWARRKGRKE